LLGKEAFLVVNGDVFADIDFRKVVLKASLDAPSGGVKNTLAHLVMVDNPPQHPLGDFVLRQGLIESDGEDRLTFSGIGVYHPDLFSGIQPGEAAKLAPLLKLAIQDKLVTGQHHRGKWYDIGTPQRLAELDAQLAVSF
jgi:MurNAc alpha-1-phosphate uridylyltransferase